MSSITVSLIILACVFGGALLGIFLHAVLPQHHLSNETKDIVKLGMGLVGTMAALVLGLLVASAKGSYDAQSAELTQMSANIGTLDRALALYGPETKEIRAMLRGAVVRIIDQMWPKDGGGASPAAPSAAGGEILYEKIQGLSPKNDTQRSLQGQALSIAVDIGKMRYLMYAQQATSVSMPLLVVLVLWLTVIFISFGLFAPFNATVVSSLFVSALSVSGAIFLILEMYTPYSGVIAISGAPLRAALAQLGQ
jgi:hypothetical protein